MYVYFFQTPHFQNAEKEDLPKRNSTMSRQRVAFYPLFLKKKNERHNRQKNQYFVMKNMVARNYDNFMKRKKIKHL